MLFRINADIKVLVNEILDQLPKSVWTSNSTTFLDPAIGGGQFVSEIERRLLAAGHSKANIANRVFGYESGLPSIHAAIGRHGLVGKYSAKSHDEFFNLDTSMKFDVVVGNPPYQSTEDGSKRKKMWVSFATKSIDMSPIVAMVTPTAWQKTNSKYFTEISDKIKKYLTCYDSTDQYFNVGESTGYWVVNKNSTNIVQVIDTNPCTPIYNKMLRKGNRWHYRDFQQPTSDIDKKVFPSKPARDFTVPIYWTAKQVRYCRPKDVKYSGWKVIVNNSGHFYLDSDPDKYSRVDNNMAVGLGAWGIKVPNKKAGENVLTWVRSKLYRVVVTKMKTGGFNNPFIELQSLGYDKNWTDAEIYKHFKLTKEEIEYIENNAK